MSLCPPWLVALLGMFACHSLVAQSSNASSNTNSLFNAHLSFDTPISVIKSENDKRDYRYVVLENQLRVLLISDPATEKSAAALSVEVGENQDPTDRAGLAHFVEHMLFLGSKKYPQVGEYQEFIAQHGGSFNAHTLAESTRYFFDIDNKQFASALDRFAQVFVAPLFPADYVERERNAVQAEYLAKLNDDVRREGDVYRELMNPAHPSARFSTGNLATLADRDGHPLRDDLIAFYERYYSSHLMNLVVLGAADLDELEASVRSRFSVVPKREISVTNNYPPLFSAGSLPASLEIKPEKELRRLVFNFPIPTPDKFYEKKPFNYIANLLGHQAEGSLLSLLKRLGWADGIYTNIHLQSRNDAVFQLGIELTPQGVRARDQIVSLVFYCIEQLQERGLAIWRYNELQQLGDMQFRFQEKLPPIQAVSHLATTMHMYSPQEVLRGDYLYTEYDENLIKKSLSYLNSKNLLLVLTAPDIEPFRLSVNYSTPFAARKGVFEILELKPAVKKELFLPESNIFIPKRLAVKSGSMLEENAGKDARPQMLMQNKNMRVWFAQDQQFMQPRALINLRIKSPLVAANAEGAAQAQLYAALLTDQLNEYSYPARLAGIDYSATANARGYDLSVFGYSSRQGLLVNKIMEVMRTNKFNTERFTLIKENLLRSWRNQNKDLPHQVLAAQVLALQSEPAWSNAQLIAALENKTLEQFSQFASRHLIDAKMDALFYGNYFRAEALKLAVLVEHELLARQAGRDLPPTKILVLPKESEKPWLYTHPVGQGDHVVELLIQSPSTSLEDSAHMMLVRQLLQPAFYNQLRTEKQWGYIAAVVPAPVSNLEGSLLIVQSPVINEKKIIQEVNLFIDTQYEQLTGDFLSNQQSLVKKLREPARSLREQGERYWNSILSYDEQFSRRLDLADAVGRITPESLKNYYRTVFMDKNRRFWVSSGADYSPENYTIVQDLNAYKQQMQSIEQP
ncbi:MAG TPA: insulinase family protein [Cellvibrio sp.]|nr:insulinase family protein [Cellvibrio sp.]